VETSDVREYRFGSGEDVLAIVFKEATSAVGLISLLLESYVAISSMTSPPFEKDVEQLPPQLGKETLSESDTNYDERERNYLKRNLKNRHIALIRYAI